MTTRVPAALPARELAAVTPTTNAHALAAARWIGTQLENSPTGLLGSAEFPDYGLTMDAMFALAGAGVGGDLVKETGEKIWNSGTAYIDGDTQSDKNARFAAIAKTALALDVAGYDPSRYPSGTGTRDLVADLRSTLNDDGSFGSSDFPFVHALALYTLSRTADGVPASAVTWLQRQQCTDTSSTNRGAYGYGGCDAVDADGTALAVQALAAAGVPASDPSVDGAVDYLLRLQDPSGGIPSSFGGVNTNNTGLAAQALHGLGLEPAAVARMADFTAALQVGCGTLEVQTDGRFTAADLGAIAYQQDGGFDSPVAGNEDQWLRASTQAIFAFGLPTFDALTVDGATAALPAAPACTPTTTTPVTTSANTVPTRTTARPTTTRPTTTPVTSTPPTSRPAGTTSSTTSSRSSEPVTSSAVDSLPSVTASDATVGGRITVTLRDASPRNTFRVELHSAPVLLGSLTTDARGAATATFTVPASVTPGRHTLVLLAAGESLGVAVTISAAAATTSDDTTPDSTATVVPVAGGSTPPLAETGVSSAVTTLAGLGLLAVLLGAVLMVLGRRRSTGTHR